MVGKVVNGVGGSVVGGGVNGVNVILGVVKLVVKDVNGVVG